jgi:hypothetical protein
LVRFTESASEVKFGPEGVYFENEDGSAGEDREWS